MDKCIIEFFKLGLVPTLQEIQPIFSKFFVYKTVGSIGVETLHRDRGIMLLTNTKNQLTVYVIKNTKSPWLKKILKSPEEWSQIKQKLINFLESDRISKTIFDDWEEK